MFVEESKRSILKLGAVKASIHKHKIADAWDYSGNVGVGKKILINMNEWLDVNFILVIKDGF